MKYGMGKKVKILSTIKTDGRHNQGTIIGVEKYSPNNYLGYLNEKEYLSRFTAFRYKVAYIDCFTRNACTDWYDEKELG